MTMIKGLKDYCGRNNHDYPLIMKIKVQTMVKTDEIINELNEELVA